MGLGKRTTWKKEEVKKETWWSENHCIIFIQKKINQITWTTITQKSLKRWISSIADTFVWPQKKDSSYRAVIPINTNNAFLINLLLFFPFVFLSFSHTFFFLFFFHFQTITFVHVSRLLAAMLFCWNGKNCIFSTNKTPPQSYHFVNNSSPIYSSFYFLTRHLINQTSNFVSSKEKRNRLSNAQAFS